MPALLRKGVLVVQWAEDPLGVGNPHFYRMRMRYMTDMLRGCDASDTVACVSQATVLASAAVYGCSYK